MRIRTSFAGAFFVLLLLAAYLGFAKVQVGGNDKILHFVTFFALTICFYWVVDTTRRRIINMTFVVIFLVGGIGSEFAQGTLPYRQFDINDIAANLLGCLSGLGLCSWYHRRMLDRKRIAKNSSYTAVADSEEAELGIIEEEDGEDENLDSEERTKKKDTDNKITNTTANGETS